MSRLVVTCSAGAERGGLATACALGVAAAELGVEGGRRGVALVDLHPGRTPRSGLLASPAARELEARAIEGDEGLAGAARGHLCLLRGSGDWGADTEAALALEPDWLFVSCAADQLRSLLETGRGSGWQSSAVLLAAGLPSALLGLLARELRAEGAGLKVWRRAPGVVQARRALAGIDPGGVPARIARTHLTHLFALESDRGHRSHR